MYLQCWDTPVTMRRSTAQRDVVCRATKSQDGWRSGLTFTFTLDETRGASEADAKGKALRIIHRHWRTHCVSGWHTRGAWQSDGIRQPGMRTCVFFQHLLQPNVNFHCSLSPWSERNPTEHGRISQCVLVKSLRVLRLFQCCMQKDSDMKNRRGRERDDIH